METNDQTKEHGLSACVDCSTNGQPAPAYLSPSLLTPDKSAPSFEMKIVLGTAQADAVRSWARAHLANDPHVDPTLGDTYRIRSIYLDTDKLDTYHRMPGFKRRKYRLRRYESTAGIFLERKTKTGDRVRKRRSAITPAEIGRLQVADFDADWSGHWFHQRLVARQFKPQCLISYDRSAHIGSDTDGPIRLTLDRNIQCLPAMGWDLDVAGTPLSVLVDQVILELKFQRTMPTLFKRLVQEMGLTPGRASKYRSAVQTLGLAKEPG